jgi:hypothetical protein
MTNDNKIGSTNPAALRAANKLKNQTKPAVVKTPEQTEAEGTLPPDRAALLETVGGNNSWDNKPILVTMPTETVVPEKSSVNAEMVFGPSRDGSRFGAFCSDSDAASIDMVVGRGGHEAQGSQPVDPMFDKDAARIWLSQKADVDKSFGLKDGGVGISKARSCAVMKADGVRIIGREQIKLVTGTDKKNSQGGDIKSTQGVSIIAGNIDSEVQPMVKGENLTAALKELKDLNADLNAIMKQMLQAQMEFNGSLMNHFHYSTVFGNANTPSDAAVSAGGKVQIEHLQQTMRSLQVHRQNLINWDQNCLSPSGEKYVLSRWNKAN